MSSPETPKAYQLFVERYPKLGQAWELASEEGQTGPLDRRTTRLVKLAITIGAMREGAVHANVRKALAAGDFRGRNRAGRRAGRRDHGLSVDCRGLCLGPRRH